MNSYYLTLVIKPDLDEKARTELQALVSSNVDKVEKEDLWGNKDLSYPIKKQTKGYYVHYEFQSDPSKIASLDSKLKLEEDILRYLLLRAD
jgi:small subunit ribosomal protein S6